MSETTASTSMETTPSCEAERTQDACHFSILATPGIVRCPVCFHIVPPEHIGYKLHCRKCGYLESCCNPV
jgi:hypothetical protein